jgi:hypothetical protein
LLAARENAQIYDSSQLFNFARRCFSYRLRLARDLLPCVSEFVSKSKQLKGENNYGNSNRDPN